MRSALKIKILSFICLCLLSASCRSSADVTPKNDANTTLERPAAENAGLPPFATKEPDKYQASIFFASRFEEGAANFVEQTYRVARDGANRRLDFETGDAHYAKLQTADGKVYILLPKKKVYAELTTTTDAPTNLPEEISLEHLLHTKPIGASYERIGEEDLAGRRAIKYRLNFGAVKGAENARTETFVWADESLGLPVKTEIVAIENNQPIGAKNVIELREIKTEVAPEIFTVPKDFRKVSPQEIQQLLRQK